MKVAFISRATLYTSPGGDTKQIDMTAHYLRELGVAVDIFTTDKSIPYSEYDLLHFFNIIRPADIICHMERSGKPNAVSTIFLDYGAFEKTAQAGIRKWMNKVFSEDSIEYIKAIARWLKNGEKIMSKEYFLWGHAKSVKYVAQHAGILLPNSESEYRRFADKYKVHHKYHVVPNGIDAAVAEKRDGLNEKYANAVLCAARIEGRKNQLNLVRALNDSPYEVFIPGRPSPNNIGYFEQCKKEAGPNIHFAGWLSEEELFEMYRSAKVHVLPSYFETTGLSSLEAAVMGCNIVVTDRGDTRDYFGDHAWYCEPEDPVSIRQAVDAAFSAPYDEQFRKYILTHFTWAKAAEETLKGYKEVLGIKPSAK